MKTLTMFFAIIGFVLLAVILMGIYTMYDTYRYYDSRCEACGYSKTTNINLVDGFLQIECNHKYLVNLSNLAMHPGVSHSLSQNGEIIFCPRGEE